MSHEDETRAQLLQCSLATLALMVRIDERLGRMEAALEALKVRGAD